MNPVLLKPTSERSSQVIVMGRPLETQQAADYQRSKAGWSGSSTAPWPICGPGSTW
jgi:cobyric acid synthase